MLLAIHQLSIFHTVHCINAMFCMLYLLNYVGIGCYTATNTLFVINLPASVVRIV